MLLQNPFFYLALILSLVFLGLLLPFVFRGLDRFSKTAAAKIKKQPYLNFHGQWILIWLGLIMCWWPVFMAVYPGFFCYGSGEQLSSFIAGTYNTGQPLLHTFLLGQTIESFYPLVGSYNNAIAIFVSLQITLITGIFTFTLYRLNKLALHRWFKILILLYYAFFPILVMFGLCTISNTLFAAFVLLFLVQLIDFFQKPAAFWYKKSKLIIFIFATLLMLAFQFNPQLPLSITLSSSIETAHFCPKVEIPAHFNGQLPFLQQLYWHLGDPVFLQLFNFFGFFLLLLALSYTFYRRQFRAALPLLFLFGLTIFIYLNSAVFSLRPFLYLYFCLPILLIALFYPDEL